ncbi:hypothetical protein [Brachybacterium phenoliresistens]|uniref:hypothetical protein n=1 Tax=Brachybacterium phenoliresistens TaxID=396014 RepID=UPI0031DB3595
MNRTEKVTARIEAALDSTDPVVTGPTIEWALAIDPSDPDGKRRGVVVAEDGRIIAHTRHHGAPVAATYIEQADAVGLASTVLDMNLGTLARHAGGPVRHITYSDAIAPVTGALPRTDAERELVAVNARLQRLEQERQRVVGQRRAARARVLDEGGTNARVARLLGVTDAAAAKIAKGGS